MPLATSDTLPALYEDDETAWLEAMAELVRERRLEDLDLPHLAEYLADMARRDRREVRSRLVVLLTHLLKWTHQPERRSPSWRGTIIEQRQQLHWDASRGVLRNHAADVLAEAYQDAIERAATETSLPSSTFPADCPYSLDQLLTVDLTAESE